MRYVILLLSLACGNCPAQQWNFGMSTSFPSKGKNRQRLVYAEFHHFLVEKNKFQYGIYGRVGSPLKTPSIFAETGMNLRITEPVTGIPGRLQVSAGFAAWCEREKLPQAELQKDFYTSFSLTSMTSFRISYDIPIAPNISIGPFFQLWGKITGNGMAGNSVCCTPVVGLSIAISLNREKKTKAFQPIKNWLYENPAPTKTIPSITPAAALISLEALPFW